MIERLQANQIFTMAEAAGGENPACLLDPCRTRHHGYAR